MNPRVFLVAVLAILAIVMLPAIASAQWMPGSEKAAAPTASADAKAPEAAAPSGGLGLFQRRKLGLTVANITPIVKKLKAEGKWTGDSSIDAVSVAEELSKQAPKEYAAVTAPNWDNIISFIEKILPLILKLIDLFSYAPPGTCSMAA